MDSLGGKKRLKLIESKIFTISVIEHHTKFYIFPILWIIE